MPADDINLWATAQPDTSVKVRNIPTHTTRGWAAVEEMVGLPCSNLKISAAGTNAITVTFDHLGFLKHSGAAAALPPYFIQSDLSVTTYTVDIDNGAAINGYEAGMALTAGWKYLYALRNPATGTTGLLLSTDAALNDVTLPAGYTHGRRVGVFYFDATNFRQGRQHDNRYMGVGPLELLASGTATAWTVISASIATFLPPVGILRRIILHIYPLNTTSNEYTKVLIADDVSGNYVTAVSGICRASAATWTLFYVEQEIVTASDPYYKVSSAAGTTAKATIELLGFYIVL